MLLCWRLLACTYKGISSNDKAVSFPDPCLGMGLDNYNIILTEKLRWVAFRAIVTVTFIVTPCPLAAKW